VPKKYEREPLFMKTLVTWISLLSISCAANSFASEEALETAPTLQAKYEQHLLEAAGSVEYLTLFRELAQECSSIGEIGQHGMPVRWGLLRGLADSESDEKSFSAIVSKGTRPSSLRLAETLAEANGITFTVEDAAETDDNVSNVDLLYLDSPQTYALLSYQLEQSAERVNKYISVFCSNPALAFEDDTDYQGDWSEYPEFIDRSKQGLWTAVDDFMLRHPEWQVKHQQLASYGVTILEKVAAVESIVTDLEKPEEIVALETTDVESVSTEI